jgi:hypothetical protein
LKQVSKTMNPIEQVNKMSKYDSEYILGSEDEAYSDDEDEEEQPKTKEQEEERHQKEKKRLINEAYNAADWSVSTPRLQLLLQKEERRHQEILKQLASK